MPVYVSLQMLWVNSRTWKKPPHPFLTYEVDPAAPQLTYKASRSSGDCRIRLYA